MMLDEPLVWTKSTKSASSNCVEWAFDSQAERVLVRHSKQPELGVLAFTTEEWAAFLDGIRSGEGDAGNGM